MDAAFIRSSVETEVKNCMDELELDSIQARQIVLLELILATLSDIHTTLEAKP